MNSIYNPLTIQLAKELSQKLKIFDAAFEKQSGIETVPKFEGRQKLRKSGIGDEFFQFRPLQNNESSSLIDWRASAKGENLQVKEKEIHAKARLYIWLDLRPSMFVLGDKSRMSKAQIGLIIALAIADIAKKHQIEVVSFSKSKAAFHNGLLQSGLAPPQVPVPAAIIILTDCMRETDEVIKSISKVSDRTFPKALGIISEKSELDFDFVGRSNFIVPETKEAILIEDCEAAAIEYKQEIKNHFQAIEDKCKTLGIDVCRTSNIEDYKSFSQSLLNAVFRGI